MKKLLIIGVVAVTMAGCGRFDNWWSHQKSALGGLERTATVYSQTGVPIKTWNFDSQVEHQGDTYRFLVDGKATYISGGVVIIEEK